ncbi:MAG: acyl-CoA dehydrogenase family protein, partial [Anaerolineae bacterium]|nr:acyl-CoA dehydrogenase family protein [Anaerolineae bacterium]
MDFTFPKPIQLFRQMVREFAEQEVRPKAKQVDVQGWPDMDVVRKLGENGLLGVPFSQKYGGAGLNEVGYRSLLEIIGGVCT